MQDATPEDVARFMLQRLEDHPRGLLFQDETVDAIIKHYGERFTYINRNDNPAINLDVLTAFQEITGDRVVWERGSRLWRWRKPNDPPGRAQEG